MISVLVVDDDEDKTKRIRSIVEKGARTGGARVDVAKSVFEAGVAMARWSYDLLLLDIMLPVRRGEEARPDGGIKILESFRSATPPRVPSHIVGITAYSKLLEKHAGDFGEELWSIVHYDPSSNAWEIGLSRRVEHIVGYLESLRSNDDSTYNYDLGIVTALHEVELEAVLGLDAGWEEFRPTGHDVIFHLGRFSRAGRSLRVVAAAAVEMGMSAAATLTTNMIWEFRPRYLAMVGVAAGVCGKAGDILVAEHSWDYGSGKVTTTEEGGKLFLPAPSSIPLSPALKNKLHWFAMRGGVLDKVQGAWMGAPSSKLAVLIGPVATGAAVLADRSKIDEIVARDRKLVGVEMEIYGVYQSATNSREPRPQVFALKSVSDFGDESKKDEFKSYAAFTSARYLYEFALQELAEDSS